MIRFNIYLTQQQIKALRELAQNGISVSEHIRRAIDLYLAALRKEKGNE